MLDLRFYEIIDTPKISTLAAATGVTTSHGYEDRIVASFASATTSGDQDLTFFDGRVPEQARSIRAAACYIKNDAVDCLDKSVAALVCADPRYAFARAIMGVARRRELAGDATRNQSAGNISPTAMIEPGVVLGEGVAIGEGSRIGANAVLGPGVQIGRNCRIGSNASVYCALVGDNVALLSGVVVGETGFGLSGAAGGLLPHFGRVILQDGVTVGANSCIDRGMLEDTVIGEQTHIDNLCHIGHNVRVGARTAMAAFAGISGSSEIGDDVQFGGRVGLGDHIKVGKGARIAAGAAVLSDIPAGETHAGYPAKPIRTWMRELAWLARATQKRTIGKD